MFYPYSQNNSGGSFDFAPAKGISHFVWIEADSPEEADLRAKKIGIYFDLEYNWDCPCCGTRWSPAEQFYASETANYYGERLTEFFSDLTELPIKFKWISEGPEVYVHYKDGTFEGFLK